MWLARTCANAMRGLLESVGGLSCVASVVPLVPLCRMCRMPSIVFKPGLGLASLSVTSTARARVGVVGVGGFAGVVGEVGLCLGTCAKAMQQRRG